jgi:hypothetical protein
MEGEIVTAPGIVEDPHKGRTLEIQFHDHPEPVTARTREADKEWVGGILDEGSYNLFVINGDGCQIFFLKEGPEEFLHVITCLATNAKT